MAHPKYERPTGADSAVTYKARIDAASKVFERHFGAFAAHEQDIGSPAPDLSVRVNAGQFFTGSLTEVDAQTVSGFTVPSVGATRVDRVVINPNTGVCSRVAGTEASGSPSATPPAIPTPNLPICRITLTSADTAITNAMITDERSFGDFARFVDGIEFDGVNDYLQRSSDLTGLTSGKQGIVSAWCRFDAGLPSFDTILANLGSLFNVRRSGHTISVNGNNAAGVGILGLESSATYTASATWRHILASWDLVGSPSAGHLYIDDVSDVAFSLLTNDTIAYATGSPADWFVGAANNVPNTRYNGGLAEVFFHDSYLDLSVETNRRKFRSASGRPVPLGADGSRPLGVAPRVYLTIKDGEDVLNFMTNRGSGGDFSVNVSPRTLSRSSTSPSD